MSLALPEIRQKGWQALVKELGYAGATKFMLLFDPGRGDYVEDRKGILRETTIEKIREDLLKDYFFLIPSECLSTIGKGGRHN